MRRLISFLRAHLGRREPPPMNPATMALLRDRDLKRLREEAAYRARRARYGPF